MERVLMKGNEIIGEAAIRSGCRLFFGYPITPSTEVIEYLSAKFPDVGGTIVQAEDEIGAINMCYGAACTGNRVMTASSSPGVSLKQEGLSYSAAAELPMVVVNVNRCGPGLGGLGPAQSDYFQATKGGGHGDYRLIVLAPSKAQELYDYTMMAFDLAEKYRNPVMILSDGFLGQTMEPVILKEKPASEEYDRSWIVNGAKGREKRIIASYSLTNEIGEENNLRWEAKYKAIEEQEQQWEEFQTDDAETVFDILNFFSPKRKRLFHIFINRNIKEFLRVFVICLLDDFVKFRRFRFIQFPRIILWNLKNFQKNRIHIKNFPLIIFLGKNHQSDFQLIQNFFI